MRPVCEAIGISFHAGSRPLLRDVSLSLEPGRLTAVIGPNGAGKSTLVRCLSGERAPSAGAVLWDGRPVGEWPGWRLACLRAVLPQSARLAFPFTAREVVRIGMDGIGRGLSVRRRAALLDDALASADVGYLADRLYQTLSGGEGARVQFARVLAQLAAGSSVAERQALILDEPIASLDLRHQLALLDRALALARIGVAVLAILHDLNLAAAYADRLVVLADGRKVADGEPVAVLDDALVSGVFGVRLRVGAVPPGGRPFLLPVAPGVAPAQQRDAI